MGKIGAGKLLEGIDSEVDLFSTVRDAYGCDEELEMNARCLWIWRKLNDNIIDRWKEMFGYERMD